MSAGRIRYLAPGAKEPKTPMFRLRFEGGGELVLTEGGQEEAGRRLARDAGAGWRRTSPTSGRTRSTSDAALLGEILGRERRQLHPLLRDQRAIAGIGRAHANEILLRARLSPFKASTELEPAEVETPRRPRCGRTSSARSSCASAGRATRTSTASTTASVSRAPQCGTPIARVDFEEHTIYYCPSCQTHGKLLKDRRLSRLLR